MAELYDCFPKLKNEYIIIRKMCEEPTKLIGLAEMFDYKKRTSQITIGYRINEEYWYKSAATNAVELMTNYLYNDVGIKNIKAFVMPENVNLDVYTYVP